MSVSLQQEAGIFLYDVLRVSARASALLLIPTKEQAGKWQRSSIRNSVMPSLKPL